MVDTKKRDPGLDGLRAIAIILVLGYHFFPEAVPHGYLGVDIFFVLSGYFIVRQIGYPGASVPRYLWKRFLRIYPALVAVIAMTLIASWAILLPTPYQHLGFNAIVGLFSATNIYPPSIDGYFAAGAENAPLLHLWSLGVEMQVYILSALALPLITRIISIRAALLYIIVISAAWMIYTGPTYGDGSAFFDPRARLWQFALGGLVATLDISEWRQSSAFFLVVMVGAVFIPGLPHPGLHTIVVSVFAASLIPSTEGNRHSPLRFAPLPQLGRISYSLYLYHWPILVLWLALDMPIDGTGTRLGLICLSLCLSVLSWHYIEKKHTASKFTGIHSFTLATGFFLSLAVGAGLVLGHGAPNRLPDSAQKILADIRPAHDLGQTCHSNINKIIPVERACRHNEGDTPIKTAVLGDSHAMTLSGGLSRAGLPFVEYSFSGCAPTPDIYPLTHGPACAEWAEDAILAIEDDPEIGTVIIAARWAFYTKPRFINGSGGRDVHPDVVMILKESGWKASELRIHAEFRKTIERLRDTGREILIYYPGPTFGWNIKRTLVRKAWYDTGFNPDIPRSLLDKRQASVRTYLDGISGGSILRYDPLPLFCNDTTCSPISEDGVALIEDQDHFSRAGADMVAKEVLNVLQATR